MPLVACTDCGESVSDRAVACPKCGNPGPFKTSQQAPEIQRREDRPHPEPSISTSPALSPSEVSELSKKITYCDPGRYLTREDTRRSINSVAQLVRYERESLNGHLGWLYMKIKANADHHGLTFTIPGRWAKLYGGYRKDLEIYKMSGPAKVVALYSRQFGFRESFLQGEGSGPKYGK